MPFSTSNDDERALGVVKAVAESIRVRIGVRARFVVVVVVVVVALPHKSLTINNGLTVSWITLSVIGSRVGGGRLLAARNRVSTENGLGRRRFLNRRVGCIVIDELNLRILAV